MFLLEHIVLLPVLWLRRRCSTLSMHPAKPQPTILAGNFIQARMAKLPYEGVPTIIMVAHPKDRFTGMILYKMMKILEYLPH